MQGPYPYFGASGVIDSVDGFLFDGTYLLITEDGNLFSKRLPIAFETMGKFWVNNHAHVVQPMGDIPLGYLKAYANSVNLAEFVTGTTRPKLTQAALNRIPVPVPPLAEQRRIVAEIEKQFTRIDASVDALKRAQANLKRYRASVLKTACEGRLVPAEAELARVEGSDYERADKLLERILAERRARWESQEKRGRKYKELVAPDTSDLPELPEGWAWGNIGQLATVGTGSTPLKSIRQFYQGGAIPWTTSGAVNKPYVTEPLNFVTEEAVSECNLMLYPPNTLLVAMYGEGKTRGKCSELLISSTVNQAIAAIALEDSASGCRQFAKLFLNYNYEDTRRLSSGGVQPNLNLGLVRQVQVPLPPLAEQRRIVAEVERRLSVVQQAEVAVEAGLVRAERLRQSILKLAFSGKLVPQDPDDEPASTLLERIRAEREAAEAAAKAKNRPRRRRLKTPSR